MIVEMFVGGLVIIGVKHGLHALTHMRYRTHRHRALMLAPVRDERGLAIHLPRPSSTHQPRATQLLDTYRHELESNAAWAADPPATAPPWARSVPIPNCLQCGGDRKIVDGFAVHVNPTSCRWRDTPIAMPVAGPGAKRSG